MEDGLCKQEHMLFQSVSVEPQESQCGETVDLGNLGTGSQSFFFAR